MAPPCVTFCLAHWIERLWNTIFSLCRFTWHYFKWFKCKGFYSTFLFLHSRAMFTLSFSSSQICIVLSLHLLLVLFCIPILFLKLPYHFCFSFLDSFYLWNCFPFFWLFSSFCFAFEIVFCFYWSFLEFYLRLRFKVLNLYQWLLMMCPTPGKQWNSLGRHQGILV